jgi:hypothetical protein
MKKTEMLTIRNAEVRIVDEWNAVVFNKWQEHTITMAKSGFGPVADRAALRFIKESGAANWSDDEIAKLAHHIEERAILSGL